MNAPTFSLIASTPLSAAVFKSYFPSEMPVSYDSNGDVASRYGSSVWNLSNMSTDGTSVKNLHFYQADSCQDPNLGGVLRDQHKALMWLHMGAGKTRSWSTLLNANLALHVCCKKAAEKDIDLYSLLTNPDEILETAQWLNMVYLRMLSSVIRTLWRHRQELRVPTDFLYQNLQSVLVAESHKRPEDKQTPLIPSRVYCTILAALDSRMGKMEVELETLLQAFATEREYRWNPPKAESQKERDELRTKALGGIEQQMKVLGYRPARSLTLASFIAARINEHKVALMIVISAYTGMRVGEVSILPLDDVLIEFEHMGCRHYEVRGWTHKLNKGVKVSTTWITSDQGARAVRLAQKIAKTIEQCHGDLPKLGQQALLFSSNKNAFKALGRQVFFSAMIELRLELCPVIEPSDIEELDHLELARDWAREDIVVGARWPLAFHQLRRSLAVYAHRSGMVSLPALKAQLQHITQEMTSYYADGFSRAVNLVFDKEHFSHEWKAAKAESSYFAFALGVLFSDEDLLGHGAQRIANTAASRDGLDILQLFEENKLAYRETPLGGCVSIEDCKTDPLEPIPYDCLETNCVNLVVFSKRLEHIIKHQEVAVATLAKDEAGSVEHRLEASHLKVLLKARERFRTGDR